MSDASESALNETDEADELLKEEALADPQDNPAEDKPQSQILDTYELSFLNQVDVFKKN